MAISDYLTSLVNDRDNLVTNLTTMGITGLIGDETFTELVPEVLNIPSGGGNEWDWESTVLTIPDSAYATNQSVYTSALCKLKELHFKGISVSGYISSRSLTYPLSLATMYGQTNQLRKIFYEDCTFATNVTPGQCTASFITETSFKNCDFTGCASGIRLLAGSASSPALITATFENCDFTGVSNFQTTFAGFRGTQLILDSNAIKGNPVVINMSNMFRYNPNLTLLDISAFDFTSCTSRTDAFGSLPTNCTILVKDQANQTALSGWFSNYTFTVKT